MSLDARVCVQDAASDRPEKYFRCIADKCDDCDGCAGQMLRRARFFQQRVVNAFALSIAANSVPFAAIDSAKAITIILICIASSCWASVSALLLTVYPDRASCGKPLNDKYNNVRNSQNTTAPRVGRAAFS